MVPSKPKKCFKVDFMAYDGINKAYNSMYIGVDTDEQLDNYINERVNEDGELYFKVIGIHAIKPEDEPRRAFVRWPYH